MADQYPVQAYLHRIKQRASAECPFCSEAKETLAHFACVCQRFREGRTAAHNQVHKLISLLRAKCLPNRWELHGETPMANTGLRLNRVSASCMDALGRPLPDIHDDTICIGRLQPDLPVLLMSQPLQKIAIVEVSRAMD
jgi:hypothetical protein